MSKQLTYIPEVCRFGQMPQSLSDRVVIEASVPIHGSQPRRGWLA
jgi:hypothetical protein